MVRNPVRAAHSAARQSQRLLRAYDARIAATPAPTARSTSPTRSSVRILGADRTDLPATEAYVLAALRGWDVPAVAVSGVHITVAAGRGRASSAETDILLILPCGAITLEVKGLTRRVGGMLSCPVQGDWVLPGIDGDPVHSPAGGNPLDQVKRVLYGFKKFAETVTGTRVFVDGVVLVVPWEGTTVTLDKGSIPMPTGRDVLVCDPGAAGLRAWYLRRARRRDTVWTAERVAGVLAALGYTSTNRDPDTRVSVADLAALGFPSTSAADFPLPSEPLGTDPDAQVSAAAPASNYFQPTARPARRRSGKRQWAVAVAIAAVWVAVMLGVGSLLSHHTADVHPPAPALTTIEPAPLSPSRTAPARVATPAPCFPLQPC